MHPPTAPRVARESRLLDWGSSIGITLLALFLRLWDLKRPHRFEFDETYYAKDAWSLLHFGYVRNYEDGADKAILAGHTLNQWADGPSMIVHPEVGKWIIALGLKLFGMDPFGWRIASAVVGSLMVLVMIRLAKRVTGSLLLGLVAGVLLCFDGLQFVLSRLALIDIFLAFFILLAVHFVVADRQWMRDRVEPVADDDFGIRLPWRPWLLAAGITLGLAVGTKWSALYLIAVFGLLFRHWCADTRRRAGVRRWWWRSGLYDAAPGVAYLVVVPAVVYLLSWTGWLMNAHEYEQALSNTQYGPYWGNYLKSDAHGFLAETWQSLRSLWHYHHDVYAFHTKFLNSETHVYQSNPLGWPILGRSVGVDVELDIAPGAQGCAAATGSTCLRQVLLLGTPALWWFGVGAMLWAAFSNVVRRDWRYGVALFGFLGAWLPWFLYDDRPIFSYYAVVMLPFMVLAVTMVLGQILGPRTASLRRRRIGAVVAGAVVFLVVLNFAYFWPIYTDGLLTRDEWLQRIWFKRWI